VFYRYGIKRHLDGFFCLFPDWIKELKDCIDNNDWKKAASVQHRITSFGDKLMKKYKCL
jgi:hypothetical protein